MNKSWSLFTERRVRRKRRGDRKCGGVRCVLLALETGLLGRTRGRPLGAKGGGRPGEQQGHTIAGPGFCQPSEFSQSPRGGALLAGNLTAAAGSPGHRAPLGQGRLLACGHWEMKSPCGLKPSICYCSAGKRISSSFL